MSIHQRLKTLISQVQESLSADFYSYDLKRKDAIALGYDTIIDLEYFSENQRTKSLVIKLFTNGEDLKIKAIEEQGVSFALTETVNGEETTTFESEIFDSNNAKKALKKLKNLIAANTETEQAVKSAFNVKQDNDQAALEEYNTVIETERLSVAKTKESFYNACEALNTARVNIAKDIQECEELKEIKRIEAMLQEARTKYVHKVRDIELEHNVKNIRKEYNESKTNWMETVESFASKSLKLLSSLKLPLTLHRKHKELVTTKPEYINIEKHSF